MKKQHIIRIILAIVALLVWGNNLIQLFTPISDDSFEDGYEKPAHDPAVETQDSLLVTEPFVYSAQTRDPFQHAFSNPRKKPAQTTKAINKVNPTLTKAKPAIPQLRLTGLIRDERGVMAILEKQNGEVVFAREKDEVDGVVLKKISGDSLSCSFGKERFWLKLPR